MCSCHSILECCVMFSGVKLSVGSFVLFHETCKRDLLVNISKSSGGIFDTYFQSKHMAGFHNLQGKLDPPTLGDFNCCLKLVLFADTVFRLLLEDNRIQNDSRDLTQ